MVDKLLHTVVDESQWRFGPEDLVTAASTSNQAWQVEPDTCTTGGLPRLWQQYLLSKRQSQRALA